MHVSTGQRYFVQLFVSILVSVSNGAIFCFGIFSPFMKEGGFSLSQTDVNIISTCGVVLSYFSLPTGYLYDTYGPRVTLFIGAALNFVGWLGMAVIFYDIDNPILGNSAAVIGLFFGISQWSASFYETGSVLTNLEAMSLHKGRVIIIQKTFMGLGSSIITQLYVAFFEGQTSISNFFFFLMVSNTIMGLIGAWFIRLPTDSTRVDGLNLLLNDGALLNSDHVSTTGKAKATPTQAEKDDDVEDRHSFAESSEHRFIPAFRFGVVVLLLNVAFVTGATIYEAYRPIGEGKFVLGGGIIVLLLIFVVMVFLVPAKGTESITSIKLELHRERYGAVEVGANDDIGGCNDEEKACSDRTSLRTRRIASPATTQTQPQLNASPLTANIVKVEMWLMLIVSFAVWGCGTVVSSNSTQIYQALDFDGYNRSLDSVYVSIYGVASAVGRIVVGFAEGYLRKRGLHAAYLFPLAPIVNVIGIPLFFVIPAKGLILPFFLCGLATGLTWGSTVLVVKSIFAADNCGKHYNALYVAGMITPLVMNVALFGPLYDAESQKEGLNAMHLCRGASCIVVPLMLSLALNLIAVPCALLFTKRVAQNRGF